MLYSASLLQNKSHFPLTAWNQTLRLLAHDGQVLYHYRVPAHWQKLCLQNILPSVGLQRNVAGARSSLNILFIS